MRCAARILTRPPRGSRAGLSLRSALSPALPCVGCPGCAGCFTAHAALPLYAMAFERAVRFVNGNDTAKLLPCVGGWLLALAHCDPTLTCSSRLDSPVRRSSGRARQARGVRQVRI